MWPWGHVAFAYVLYSIGLHAFARRGPTDRGALTVAGAALLPDLIDKPLAWTFHVMPSGYGVAHSALVAGPIAAVLALVLWWTGRPVVAGAFAVGYEAHLLGDVLYPAFLGRSLGFERVLWPVVRLHGGETVGFTSEFLHYFTTYVSWMVHGRYPVYVAVQLALAVAVVALWLYDGYPGPGGVRRAVD